MIHKQDVVNEYLVASHYETKSVLRRLLILSLSPLELKVYNTLLVAAPDLVPSSHLAQSLGKQLNQTGNIVKGLRDAGIVVTEYGPGEAKHTVRIQYE